MKTTTFLPIACGALLAVFSVAAVAQDAPKKVLTRDEFRACMDSGDAIKARSDALKVRAEKQKPEIEAVQAEYQQLLEEEKRVKDSMAAGAQDRFERKKKAHIARGKAAEEASKALQADFDAFSKDLDAYNTKCSGVAVNRDDREAVMKEREAAGKK